MIMLTLNSAKIKIRIYNIYEIVCLNYSATPAAAKTFVASKMHALVHVYKTSPCIVWHNILQVI
jgi:hypothetical protein